MTIRSWTAARQPLQTLFSFADGLVADQQPRGNMRVLRDESVNQRERGIVGSRRAEDDLVARIVEMESRTQRVLDVVFQSADRPNQTYARDGCGARRAFQAFLAEVNAASAEKPGQSKHAQRGLLFRRSGNGLGLSTALCRDQNAADVSGGRENAVRSDSPNRNRHGRAMSRTP
jgi:hypothetical protein